MPTNRNQESTSGEIPTQGLRLSVESNQDRYLTGGLIAFFVVVVAAVLAAVFTAKSDGYQSSGDPHKQPVEPRVMITSPQAKLDILHAVLMELDATKHYSNSIPRHANSLREQHENPTEPPEIRAASWLLHEDDYNDKYQMIRRFALAAFYYGTNGDTWNRKQNWLSGVTHCTWHGVLCTSSTTYRTIPSSKIHAPNAILELDLAHNNLAGPLPDILLLLRELRVVFLNDNNLTGELNPSLFSVDMPHLQRAYLQYNNISGHVPSTLRDNGVLDAVFLHGNSMTGVYPEKLCRSCPICSDGIPNFGIDCHRVTCPTPVCCDRNRNCFNAR